MNLLVTGGGGYLGCVLVRQLLHDLHRVTVLDRFTWGVQPLASVAQPTLSVIAGDIRDARTVKEALVGMDAVIHLAGIVGYPACDADPDDADTTNVEGTRQLCRYVDGRPIYFASTGSTYGKVEGVATESTSLSPLTRYGRNKAEAEGYILEAGGTVLRLATLFGLSPRMRWDLLPHSFARDAVQKGEIRVYDPEARRTFLHVEDAAAAFRYFVEHPVSHGVWNIGDGALNLSKRQVAERVQVYTDCRIAPALGYDPDERDYTVGYQKVRTQTAWYSQWGLDLGGVVQFARVWR